MASAATKLSPPEGSTVEVISGVAYTHPRPSTPHVLAMSVLGYSVTGPFHFGRGGPGGWVILDEPELHLRRDILVPDLAGWRRERMPEVVRSAAIDLPPDWVCESLSSGSTAAFDKAVKMPVYAKAGVKHLWLVDTDNFTVEVFRLQKKQWLLVKVFAGAVKVRAEPFDAVELDLTPLWVK